MYSDVLLSINQSFEANKFSKLILDSLHQISFSVNLVMLYKIKSTTWIWEFNLNYKQIVVILLYLSNDNSLIHCFNRRKTLEADRFSLRFYGILFKFVVGAKTELFIGIDYSKLIGRYA